MSMQYNKIIFSGPVGAGKSTAIATLSEVPVVSTEALATDETRLLKSNTTVAMDYGVLNLDNGKQIHLYGTPGQERFDFMWDILTQGGIGLVLLVNNSAPDPIGDMKQFIKSFSAFIEDTGVVIGVTQSDKSPQPSIDDYHAHLTGEHAEPCLKQPPPIFAIDARNRNDVRMLVEALMYVLDPDIAR